MQKLVEGIHRFQNGVFSSKQRLFEGLMDGQHPLALFVTCSDSCIDADLLTQTEPGELLILHYHPQEDQFVPIEGKSFPVPSAARELPSM